MITATLNDAWVRTEHYLRRVETEFYQIGGSWDQDVSDSFRFTLLGGVSKSDADIPVETTIVFDDRDAQGYQLRLYRHAPPDADLRHQRHRSGEFPARRNPRPSVERRPTSSAPRSCAPNGTSPKASQVKAGGVYRRFDFDIDGLHPRHGGVRQWRPVDRRARHAHLLAHLAFGPTAIYGFPATPRLSELFTLGNAGQPAGTTNSWLIPNLDAAAAYTGLYNRTAAHRRGQQPQRHARK